MRDVTSEFPLASGAPPSRPSLVREQEVGIRDFLAFVVGDEHYALALSAIREIMKLPPVTEVPMAPPAILGIVSVRGLVTTVIDLRRKLRMPEGPVTSKSRVLLVDKGEELIGMLVDRVLQVYRLREDEVELAATTSGELAEYVLGIGRPGLGRPDEEKLGLTSQRDEAPWLGSGTAADTSLGGEVLILLDPITLLKG